ncbi:hypothetical protein HDZ31DRAFT_79145 [Schizophyllum fasciatum]
MDPPPPAFQTSSDSACVPTLDSSSPSQPTFPTNVPTHPLIIVDYEHIRAGDSTEIDQLWKAATTLGFWYLKNHGTTAEVDNMFAMGEDVMRLPIEEKMKYEQGDTGNSFGYKHAGANATNAAGAPDTIEFLNIAQDHALAAPHPPAHRYPPCVPFPLVTAFVRRAAEVNLTLMRALGARLGLSRAFEARHALGAPSGSEVRFTRNAVPRGPGEAMRKGIGAHTDFGSLSFVHNRLGGLQVLPPGSDEWQYVKPLPDHAVCNIGDALSILSGGILRSNLHRVVPPPPPQNHLPRTSLVFLTRPARDVVLRALTEESALVRDAVEERQARGEDVTPYFGTSTAGEWFERRIRGWRIRNREGPQTWIASRGTEGRDEGDIPDETRAGEAVK